MKHQGIGRVILCVRMDRLHPFGRFSISDDNTIVILDVDSSLHAKMFELILPNSSSFRPCNFSDLIEIPMDI